MYDEKKDLRIARANTPIRLLVSREGKVWIYIPEEFANEIATKRPDTYLDYFEKCAKALYNQDFYFVDDDGNIHIACPVVEKGKIQFMEFVGKPDGNYIRLSDIRTTISTAEWRYVKSETRRIAKNKLR